MKIKDLRKIIADKDGDLDICVIARDGSAYALRDFHDVGPVDDDGCYGDDAKEGWSDALLLEID